MIRFEQNQNLASPKTFDLLRLCVTGWIRPKMWTLITNGHLSQFQVASNFDSLMPIRIVLKVLNLCWLVY